VTLAASLADWTDVDVAAHELARCLGALPEGSAMSDAKWVYWSNNPLGIELVALLDRLTALGLLEKRDEPDHQYRVAPEFRASLGVQEIWQRFVVAPPPALTLVVVRCAALAQSLRFYETLGIVFMPEQHGSGPHHYSARLGATILELYPAAEPTSPIRLGVGVPDVSGAVAAVRALADCVIRFEPDRLPPSALVRDPDGNKIELSALNSAAISRR
jgi:catechol 2,3-dioxygenase-like lactoylglutathione lyase family enzyme